MRVLRLEPIPPLLVHQAFDRKCTVEQGNDHVIGFGGQRSVHNQNVFWVNTCSGHGVTRYPDKESRCRVFDQVLVEIELFFYVVVGRGGEARRDRLEVGQVAVDAADFNDGHTCVRFNFGATHGCFLCEAAGGDRASVLHSML